MKEPRLFITQDPTPWMHDTISIRFGGITDTGRLMVAKPVEMILVPENEVTPHEPMLIVDTNYVGEGFLQHVMDQLWALGIRPKDIGTPGHLAATKEHLNDMRALVSHALQVKLDMSPKRE